MSELHVALDLPDAPSAVAILDLLPDRCPVKVGSVLMTKAGSGFIRSLVANGHPVFLDLKWHDIPSTVRGAVEAAVDLGASMVTVHALGGPAMIEAAAKASQGRLAVVAVTVLTSHEPAGFAILTGRSEVDLRQEVSRLAQMAMAAGASGVVCSAEELAAVAGVVGTGRIVVPGIRRAEDALADQTRVATPEAAVAAGATDLVVGRPITAAEDPKVAYEAFLSATRTAVG